MTLNMTYLDKVKYTSQDFNDRFADLFGNGILKNTDFPVTYPTTPNMTLNIGIGTAIINGYRINNDAVTTLIINLADVTNPRIDIVQLGYSVSTDSNGMTTGNAVLQVKQGVAATSPIEPGADANFTKLFAINVAANATQITSSNVIDRRTLVPINVNGSQLSFNGVSKAQTLVNSDLNILIDNGNFYVTGQMNGPVTNDGQVLSIVNSQNTNNAYQQFTDSTDRNVYYRFKVNGTWDSSWTKLVNYNDLSTQTKSLVHGTNTITTSQVTNVQPKFYGRTQINYIPSEEKHNYDVGGGVVSDAGIDTSIYQVGTASRKYTYGTATSNRDITYMLPNLPSTKYYYMEAWIRSDGANKYDMLIKDTSFAIRGQQQQQLTTANTWQKFQLKFQGFDASAIAYISNMDTYAQTAWIDGWSLQEITQADYNTLDVNAISAKYPYVEAIKHVNGAYLQDTESNSHLYLQDNLASILDNSVQDTAYEYNGQWYKSANFKQMDLDGSLGWTFNLDATGYKSVYAPLPQQSTPDTGQLAKYDGKILSRVNNGGSFSAADQQVLSATNILVSIADTDSGWGETYTPTVAEIQAYFFGWKMYQGGQGDTSVSYTSGAKAWIPYDAIIWAGNSGDGTAVVNMCPTQSIQDFHKNVNYTQYRIGIEPYKLTYQLSSAQEQPINVEGEVSLINGTNTVTVGEGVIVREAVKPGATGPQGIYVINYDNNTKLNHQLTKLLAVYKNGVIDNNWIPVSTPGSKYGDFYIELSPSLFDQTASYTVTYLVRPYTISANEQQVDVSYETSFVSVVQQNTDDIQGLTQNVSSIQNDYASKNQPAWIPITTQNGWITSTTDEPTVFMKDSMGFVHIKGMIKSGTTTNDTIIFTLPPGYRPAGPYIHAVTTSQSNGTWGLAQLRIFSDGTVHIDFITGNSLLNLNIIPFLAEN